MWSKNTSSTIHLGFLTDDDDRLVKQAVAREKVLFTSLIDTKICHQGKSEMKESIEISLLYLIDLDLEQQLIIKKP